MFYTVTAIMVVALVALAWRSPVRVEIAGKYGDNSASVRVAVLYLRGWLRAERELAWTLDAVSLLPPSLRVLFESTREKKAGDTGLDDFGRLVDSAMERSGWGPGVSYLSRRWRVARLEADIIFGLGNPTLTAVGYGAVWGVVGTALAALQERWPVETLPRIKIEADFRRRRLAGDCFCILTFSMGDAVTAGWLEVKERIGAAAWRRHRRWSIPSRA